MVEILRMILRDIFILIRKASEKSQKQSPNEQTKTHQDD